jgi:hypothetical protein
VCGSLGEGRQVVAVGGLSMDLSRWGQSRDAQGRHPAARPGLGTWVGARVASPRCPILRPGSSSVLGTMTTWQSGARSAARKVREPDPARDRAPGSGGGSRSLTERGIVGAVRGSVYCVIYSAFDRIFKIRRIVRDGIAVI